MRTIKVNLHGLPEVQVVYRLHHEPIIRSKGKPLTGTQLITIQNYLAKEGFVDDPTQSEAALVGDE